MSTAKENPCRKFQANFFNKSKCQNCFKPRELHLLTDQDLTQAKPIYGGWLCLAPEGTDFDNPMQRSRKWQRRFFVLYEHGCLRFALDESPSTLPQGTVNMNLCTDVIDAEPKTGQKNSLCIITPDQEYFIRGENKEIINGWSEQLVVYPRTNKQNQKKKRKVEPATSQEPGPAKVAVTGSGIPEAEKVPDSSSIIWQEELNQREAEGAIVWAPADVPPGSPLPSTGECVSVGHGSDAGSVNGDEVDRGSLPMHSSVPQPPSDLLSPTGSCSSLGGVPRCLSPAPSDPFPSGSSLLSNGSHISGSVSSLDSDASGSTVTSTDSHPTSQRGSHPFSHHDTPRSRRLEAEARKAEKRSRYRSPDRQEREAVLSPERSRSGVIEKLEALELENQEKMEVEELGRTGERQGRSEHRRFYRERHDVGQGRDFPSTLPPLRRAKSLDRRTTESVMTPDLLNFKKGWMVKLDEQGQWKKYWFVLTDHSLRYYKDSIAEEASDLDGEIDLSTCYNVTEYQAQRNYGFQIHTQEGVHTLSAMTAGIRRNWIQAVMKNVRPSTAPDVASSTEDHGSFPPLEGLVRPDVTQDSPSSEASVERESAPGITKSRARERRREGRSKTFDWAEFRPIAQALAQQRAQEAESLQADLGELERSRRREERRKRYESVTSSSTEPTSPKEAGRTDYESGEGVGQLDSLGPTSLERQQRVEEVIEQHWQQVEKTPIRDERRVPLPTTAQTRETAELEQLLENYKQGIEDLKLHLQSCHQQLIDSNNHKQVLEQQLRTALEREQDIRTGYISPLEHPLGLEADVTPQTKRPELVSSQAQSLTKKYQETKELLKLQELKKRNMQAQLGLSLSQLPIKEPYLSDPSILESPPPETVQKPVSILLQDSSEAIQDLEDLISGKTLTLTELGKVMKSYTYNQATTETHQLQKLLETWKYQQEIDNETIKNSLAKAGEIIREYEARLLTMEDLVGKVQKQELERLQNPYGPLSTIENHSETNEMTVGMLSQRVELLTNENGALKQRCQEIVNQLTEADREIDRLKAELISQQGGKQHHLVMEELKRLKAELAENQANAIDREYYERELNEKSLRLHEALVTLEELGNTLKDTEKKLQLKDATLKGLGFPTDYEDEELQPEKEQLNELLEASQTKLFETEANLQSTEQRCIELDARNSELMALNQEYQKVSGEKLEEAENEIRMLKEKLGIEKGRAEMTVGKCVAAGKKQVDDKELIKQVVEEVEMRSEAINQVVEMLGKVDVNVERMLSDLKSTLFGSLKEEPFHVSPKDVRLVVEGEFWSQLLGTSEIHPEETHCSSGRSVAEQMMAQKRLMILTRGICSQANVYSEVVTMPDFASMYSWLDNEKNAMILKELTETLEAKSNSLKQLASKVKLDEDDMLLSMAQSSFGCEQKQPCDYLLEAFKEACTSYVIIRLNIQHDKELKHKQTEVQACGLDCPNCPKLREVVSDLQSKLTDLQGRLSEACLKTTTGPQTLIQIEGEPIDSLDKTIELQDMIARHRKELQEVKDGYEEEAEKMRQEIATASETLHLRSEENVKEIDSLTGCMENLKKKHELERSNLTERFDGEMEELRSMMSPVNPERTSTDGCTASDPASAQTSTLKQRIQELVTQVSVMTEEMKRRKEQGDATTQRLKYEKDLENLKATCERGFAAMEDSHQKVIDELQRKHQRELENLHEEKERLLAEETAATISAIEAMKNAHRSELEKELDRARKANNNAENADMDEMARQHEEELCSYHREIEVLSEQYSQKCLENAHLAQALEAERQALRQCQRENQELNAHNQELNNRLAAEITKMRSMTSEDGVGDTNTTIQGKELYELEVMLRVKESEVQYLKQEINSLKDELQSAQRDKKYATDKYKDIYTELSIVKAKGERDLGRLRDQLQLAHDALGEPSLEEMERVGYDIMKSKSNPDILKMAAAAAKRSERTMRSKSLKEGLTAEQRLHLFENKDTKEF
ncbi:myosin phosphatase Rho-interacting protein isoform X3 [Hippoglossus hippoglossus]|uniref:myosin phosphatase Rho-interacting protein isoform X3 n=1 Tax=Hippoglossus hippoglossus TaxID=8267 RepID=UPI00148D0488|nr:myosin phosphatase Rho-interacting protein isoform X3 [Hippoglossus hippoglossus]